MLDNVKIVLIETSHPGNIGAAARAMKTMGLSRLALVNPIFFPDPKAVAMASRADDILDGAGRIGVIFYTRNKDIQLAVEAVKKGALDYIVYNRNERHKDKIYDAINQGLMFKKVIDTRDVLNAFTLPAIMVDQNLYITDYNIRFKKKFKKR